MEKKSGATKKTAAKKAAPKKTKTAAHAKETFSAATTKAVKAKAPRSRKTAKACSKEGCKRAYRAKGYCKAHYKMWRHGKLAKPRYKRCHDYGCTKPMGLGRHGFCEEHYTNYYVKGMEQTHAPVAPAKPEKAAPAAAESAA